MNWFQNLWKKNEPDPAASVGNGDPGLRSETSSSRADVSQATTEDVDIAPDDPLLAYIFSSPGIIEVDQLQFESEALARLKAAGIRLSAPLISQGELIGLLNLGPRLSEADYSTDDRRLLNTLATQAAPALRVAQLARQQQIEARERERMEQELRVARVIQQTLLPKEIPSISGWRMAAYWQPARAVSGDFYDFVTFPDGKIAIIEGDVTDKGVPAALVMATTRSILRSAAELLVTPGKVLELANNRLCPDIPPNMFVTCVYTLLDPATGVIQFANAGHNVVYQRNEHGVAEMRARGMPLGLMPEMQYEEKETVIQPGDTVVLYSDGLVEAHSPSGEMFGFPRLRDSLLGADCCEDLIAFLVAQLQSFTGPDWEQEDDVSIVTLERSASTHSAGSLAEFAIASVPGNEMVAMERVAAAVEGAGLSTQRLERLKTAVAEATMNAIEHGNKYQDNLMVDVRVYLSGASLCVSIRDHGGGRDIPESEMPDLDAKLAGLQSPRGWGLFLIKNMVDEMNVTTDEEYHTLELVMRLKGDEP